MDAALVTDPIITTDMPFEEYIQIIHVVFTNLRREISSEGRQSMRVRQEMDEKGCYRTSLLPGLKLYIPILWQGKLPGPAAIARNVAAMVQV